MKFGIDMGHNAPPDTGASGIAFEDNLTKDVGQRVIEKLTKLGHKTVNCTPKRASSVGESLRKRVQTANSQDVDFYVSLHFNAFNGKANGTEVFAVSESGKRIAQPVLDNIVNLGFFDRKVKDGSHLYVVRNTHMPGILVECCFIDSQKDMNIFEAESMANAIVRGLTGQDPQKSSPTNSKEEAEATPHADPRLLELQKSLNSLKFSDDQEQLLEENGFLNTATEAAIKKFNIALGISNSSAAGVATWNAIKSIFAQPILRMNHADGLAVKYIQYIIGMEIDGIYGPATAKAVEKYQQSQGLTADGIIGPQSWQQLIG